MKTKIGISDLGNDLLTSMTSAEAGYFFFKNYIFNSVHQAEKDFEIRNKSYKHRNE